eukprot:m.96302 g.96302  ORF g.96302 m.96302 type:complete len:248 (+) comp26885_c0_seq1:307-1050(+)
MMISSMRRLVSLGPRTTGRSLSTSPFRAPVIGVMSGSGRQGSFNHQLAVAAATICEQYGAETKVIDLRSKNLPLYDQDLESEHGLPESVVELKTQLESCDAWVISSPEYNGFTTPLLLNAFTWCSRGDPQGKMYATFAGKVGAVISASPGPLGGMRSHRPNRDLLTALGVTVIPSSVAVGAAFKAFAEDGSLTVDSQIAMLETAMLSLVESARNVANQDAACELVTKMKQLELESGNVGVYGSITTA